ncbi:MAG TPA: hypothetical protein VD997_01920 [Phycisphaerales bacterium]|nr:hypothetical protein [Phycisphaerales bacterium]
MHEPWPASTPTAPSWSPGSSSSAPAARTRKPGHAPACGVSAPIPIEEALRLLDDSELLVLAECYGLAPPSHATRADLISLLSAVCAGRHH